MKHDDDNKRKKFEQPEDLFGSMNADREDEEDQVDQEDKEEMDEIMDQLRHEARIEEETGVRTWDEDAIYEIFDEELQQVLSEIEGELSERADLTVGTQNLKKYKVTEVFIATNHVTGVKVRVVAKADVYDDAGSVSTLTLTIKVDDADEEVCQVDFTNGEAEFNEHQGTYMPVHEDGLNEYQLTVFNDLLEEVLVSALPDHMITVEAMKQEAIRDGGKSPVAEFLCEECEAEAVSIDEALCEIGKCYNCGHQHELGKCLRCDSYFDANNASGSFCESCEVYIEEQ